MFKAVVSIRLRPSILDPQGKAVMHALSNLGFGAIAEARIGKLIELSVEADSAEEARSVATSACEKLLANPVMEDFEIDVEALEPAV